MTRTWLITGSSAGFGRALAEAALGAGDNVVATARRPDALDDLVALAPERALALPLDVTDREQIAHAVDAAQDRFGGIDVLVNNAGLATVGAVEELVESELRGVMDTMYFGPVSLVQAVLPSMRERRMGTIVQMSSMGGQVTMPGFGAYCSAKFALEAVSESLAGEVAPYGIRVLIVEPGAFATSFGGARTQFSPDSGLYDDTVGAQRSSVGSMDGDVGGDPAEAAAAILSAVGSDAPPLRLALGDDAVEWIGKTLRSRLDELERSAR